MPNILLIGPNGKKKEYKIPKGWMRKGTGLVSMGDKYWNPTTESWIEITHGSAFLNLYVNALLAVITKEVQ